MLIAGGAGFLGSYLAERFVADGHEVHILDNFASGLKQNIEIIQKKITLLENDVISLLHPRISSPRHMEIVIQWC